MTTSSSSTPQSFFGWNVVAATFVLAVFGWGVGFYGPPVFLYEVVERTNWPVPIVSAAVTTHFLTGAVVVANLPRLYRWAGVPQATVIGALLLALGTFGWASAQQHWQLFLAAFASGAGWVAMGAAAVNALIAPWFAENRPAALSMAYNGASLGGVIFSPLWIVLISAIGFRFAALAVGGAIVLVIVILSFSVFSKTPESLGQVADGEVAPLVGTKTTQMVPARESLWRDRQFLTLAAGMMLGLFAQIGLLAHLFSLLAPTLGETRTGVAMGGATLAAIIGRSAVGWFMPPSADRRFVACLSYGVQMLGSLLLIVSASTGSSVSLMIGIALFGLGIGNATSLPPLIAQEFTPSDTAKVVPMIVAIGQAGYAFAPAVFGFLRSDMFQTEINLGRDGLVLYLAAAAVQFAAIICLFVGRRDAGDLR
jgi:MFS family permease